MFLSDVSIRRPIFTAMVTLCLVVLGIMGFNRLGTDLYPDVNFPVATVVTVYRGAGPGEIETQVVKPIEDAIAGIAGVDAIHSWARENVATTVVQFTLSTNLDRAVQEVRDKVSGVSGKLPEGIEAPVVGRVDISAAPILTYAASAKMDTQKLRKLIEDRVRPTLAQIEGVAEVRVTGGDVREVQVDVELDRARAAGISPLELAQKVGMENLNLPAGRLALGPQELTVRALGQFRTVDELRALPIAKNSFGSYVRLDEVATVTDGVAERRTVARLNGQDSVIIEVVKQPGSNTMKVTDTVKAKLAELSPSLGNDFRASLIIDQSLFIRENAKEVWIALIFGGAMAILIILMFLLDVRGTLISALALPTSVIGTFFVMYVLGYALNQMTLLALSLAIGLLIDDAVVVREAITHRLEKGEEPFHAASKGTQDVGLAVLATTFSLVAVFIPVAFMPGIVGQFFKQFGITISVAVLISLFISFTLDPMLSARFAKARKPGEVQQHGRIGRTLRHGFERMENVYERILRWVLAHKVATALITVGVMVLSVVGAAGLGAEFMAAEDRGQFVVELKLPDGASLDETERRTEQAEKLLLELPTVTDAYAIVGFNSEVNTARIRVLMQPKEERTLGVQAVKELAREKLQVLPATRVTLSDPPTIEGLGDWFPIMVRVTGPDLAEVKRQAEKIEAILHDIGGTADVRIEANPPKPELQIQIDRTRSTDVGLSASALATQLRLAIDGTVAAKLREGTDETDIRVRLAERDRATPERVRALEIYTPAGLRPVSDVADITLTDGPSVIEHHNRERQIAVFANLAKGAALGEVAAKLKARVAEAGIPPGYLVLYDGQMKSFDEQNAAFSGAFGLAFIFIFMVLASQFESLKHPFTIMASLPLALVGALLGLVVTGNHVSMGAMIGIILLMGLVTKNAILLVDGALQHLREGDDVNTALLKAGPRRLRPILMTSAAMAIGMVPTAVGKGIGSEFRSPMAVSVIGGVISSTFLTLLVVPVVFAVVEKLKPGVWLRRFRRGGRDGQDDEPMNPTADRAEPSTEKAA